MTEQQNRKKFDELRLIASPQGFAVYDSGRTKLSVHAIDVFIRPGMGPLMQVALPAGTIDVVGKPMFAIVDIETGKPRVVKRVEWADGEATDFPVPEKGDQSVFNGKGETAGAVGPAGSAEAAPGVPPNVAPPSSSR